MRLNRKHAFAGALVILAMFVVGGLFAHHALAQQQGQSRQTRAIEDVPIYQEVLIPGGTVEQSASGFLRGRVRDLADYLGTVYNFLISIVGALAAVMMMVGGFQYLTAGGDKNKVDAGKKRILNALMGMVLALGSYVILNTVNPNLVNLKVPTVEKVSTELSFLPFCDSLAKQMNVNLDDFTVVSNNSTGVHHVKGDCGDAGFYASNAQSGTSTVESRSWCIFRGYNKGSDEYGYGNSDVEYVDGRNFMRICMPVGGINAKDLETEYKKDGFVRLSGNLAEKESCLELTRGLMQGLNLPIGDDTCKIWQNVANNGDPMDNTFDITKRTIVQDPRTVDGVNRAKVIFYCGWSNDSAQRCDFSNVDCNQITSCGDYEDQYLHWCKDEGRGEWSCTHETLGSKRFRDTGVVKHLYPVCNGNPCKVNSKCYVPGVAGVEGAVGGGENLRIGLQVATGSLLGTVDCSSK